MNNSKVSAYEESKLGNFICQKCNNPFWVIVGLQEEMPKFHRCIYKDCDGEAKHDGKPDAKYVSYKLVGKGPWA